MERYFPFHPMKELLELHSIWRDVFDVEDYEWASKFVWPVLTGRLVFLQTEDALRCAFTFGFPTREEAAQLIDPTQAPLLPIEAFLRKKEDGAVCWVAEVVCDKLLPASVYARGIEQWFLESGTLEEGDLVVWRRGYKNDHIGRARVHAHAGKVFNSGEKMRPKAILDLNS